MHKYERDTIKIGERFGWDEARMRSSLWAKCSRDEELRRYALDLGIYQMIRSAERTARTPQAVPVNGNGAMAEDKAFAGLASTARRRMRDWLAIPIGNGKTLGEATADDLAAAIAIRVQMAEGNLREARFFDRIKAQLSGQHRVREVLSNADLDVIRREDGGTNLPPETTTGVSP